VLQNSAVTGKVQGLHSEVCTTSSHDAYSTIRVKDEVFSDAEEEYPVPLTFVGIKAESEVSCVSIPC
jgi:hypothetical protein